MAITSTDPATGELLREFAPLTPPAIEDKLSCADARRALVGIGASSTTERACFAAPRTCSTSAATSTES